MELVCPQCNGLTKSIIICPKCGMTMEDGGKLSDYYGPYSPYEENDEYVAALGESDHVCTHLYYCPTCFKDRRVQLLKYTM